MISELFIKYQFVAIHTADITDGNVTNQALDSTESEIFRCLYLPPILLLSLFKDNVFNGQQNDSTLNRICLIILYNLIICSFF